MSTQELPLLKHWPWFAAGGLLIAAIWLLAPILTPFVVGAALAYIGDPIVDALQRRRLSRTAAVCLVFVVLSIVGLTATLLIVPLLYEQVLVLLRSLPGWLLAVQEDLLPRLGIHLPAGVKLDAEGLKKIVAEHWSEAGGIAQVLWAQVSKSGAALAAAAANLLLIPVVTFYLLRDWDDLVAWIGGMIPPRIMPTVSGLAQETDEVLGHFLRGQLAVMVALAILYSVGLMVAGLELALVIGVAAGLVSFVPYLGFVVGLGAAGVAMLLQTHEWLPVLWVAVVFGVGQVLESAVLTPNLVGDRIGLHPVAVIFAVMAGGQLFGFVGVLIALPAAAVIAVMLRHAKSRWLESPLFLADAPPPAAPPDPPLEPTPSP